MRARVLLTQVWNQPERPSRRQLLLADEAFGWGTVHELVREVAAAVEAGIRERFIAAAEAKKRKDECVAAGRRFVAAYVRSVHYVEGIHKAAMAHDTHHDRRAGAGDECVSEGKAEHLPGISRPSGKEGCMEVQETT